MVINLICYLMVIIHIFYLVIMVKMIESESYQPPTRTGCCCKGHFPVSSFSSLFQEFEFGQDQGIRIFSFIFVIVSSTWIWTRSVQISIIVFLIVSRIQTGSWDEIIVFVTFSRIWIGTRSVSCAHLSQGSRMFRGPTRVAGAKLKCLSDEQTSTVHSKPCTEDTIEGVVFANKGRMLSV